LYFALPSLRESEPVLNCPLLRARTKGR